MKIYLRQGKGSQLHNRRDYESIGREIPKHIDTNRMDLNVTLVDRDIKKAYEDIFGESVREYNAKQKRKDRKIDSYYDKILKSKNGEKPFYEMIFQLGNLEEFENNPNLREVAKECLIELVDSWDERNPNLKLIGAYIHMDEASPHLHLDYIPVATGYKKGLSKRNSLDKALGQQGIEIQGSETRKNNKTLAWQESEVKVLEEIAISKGLTLEERQPNGRPHFQETSEYVAYQATIQLKQEELKETQNSLKRYEELQIDTNDVDFRGNRFNKEEVIVSKDDFDTLLEQSKAYRVNKPQIIEIDRKTSEIAQKEQNLKNLESKLESQRAEVSRKEQKLREKEKRIDESTIIQSLKKENQELHSENSFLRDRIEKYKFIISDFVERSFSFIKNWFPLEDEKQAKDELIQPTLNEFDEYDQDEIPYSLEDEEYDEIY